MLKHRADCDRDYGYDYRNRMKRAIGLSEVFRTRLPTLLYQQEDDQQQDGDETIVGRQVELIWRYGGGRRQSRLPLSK